MFAKILKYLVLYYLNNRISSKTSSLGNIKENAADYVESRAIFIKYTLQSDLQRVVNSFFVYLGIFFAAVFSGLIALFWLFSAIAEQPNRELILAALILLPLIISAVLFIRTTKRWKDKPFADESTRLIALDWHTFRHGADECADK
jgi:hypothetical protein